MTRPLPATRLAWPKMLLAGLLMLIVAFALTGRPAQAGHSANEARDAEIMLVLDTFMDGLNELDLHKHFSTYHFPHFRYADGALSVVDSAEAAMPFLNAPDEQRRQSLLKFLGEEWDHSAWTRRDIVQGDDHKVHVATTFVRYRKDGTVIKTYDSLYILIFEDGRWGIKGRSSFAP